jgi:hypothetical protein
LLPLYRRRFYLLLSLFVERQFADLIVIANTERMILNLVGSFDGFEAFFFYRAASMRRIGLLCDVMQLGR